MLDDLHENESMVSKSAPSAIFLVGFMGAGKTSVGRELAALLSGKFVDVDDRIVEREQRAIAEIFRTDGEAAFRLMERRSLEEIIGEVQQGVSTVVALGGGALAQSENETAIRRTGYPVVFLDADPEELRRRCTEAPGTRPLFRDEQQFRALYEQRKSCYIRADLKIDTTKKSVRDIAEEIIGILGVKK